MDPDSFYLLKTFFNKNIYTWDCKFKRLYKKIDCKLRGVNKGKIIQVEVISLAE